MTDALRTAPAGADWTMHATSFTIAGRLVVADWTGALYLEAERVLVVADLHLEKASSYARRGVFLPPYDTAATLAKLALAVARFAPAMVVALGDSFHDGGGCERLGQPDREALAALQAGRDWVWISGNHDPAPPRGLGGTACDALSFGPLTLRHEPAAAPCEGEIAGHLHPVARVVSARGSARRRCFASDGSRCVLPAFGALTGGLDIFDAAFATLFARPRLMAHVIGRARVYSVPGSRCAPI